MTEHAPTDVPASVSARLLNHARATKQDFNRVLVRYGVERLLYRLSQSDLRERFVLKGAMLFATWGDAPFRATGDVDFLAFGDPGVETAKAAFVGLCAPLADSDDGLVFLPDSVTVERTRADEDYQGLHVSLTAKLRTTQIIIKIDVGFGDVVNPDPLNIAYPCLLPNLPTPTIRAYPPATVIAEKFDAMVRFGDQATRLKDHFDIWAISQTFPFEAVTLVNAVRETLIHRERVVPTTWPACLTADFAANDATLKQWSAFLKRTAPTLEPPPFADLLAALRTFLDPILQGLQANAAASTKVWDPAKGWS